MADINVTIFENSTDNGSVQDVNIFYAIFIPIFCVVTSFANLATIIAFCKVPELWERPSEVLILSLSCADFGTGLLVLPLFSPMYITPGSYPFGENICALFVFLLDVTVNASLLSLLNISIDRFLLVYKEYPRYLKMQSRYRVNLAIIVSWSISIFTGIVEMGMWRVAKSLDYTASQIDYAAECLSPPRRMQSYSLPLFMVFYFTPALLMSCFSIAFLYFLRKRLVKSRRTDVKSSKSKLDTALQMENQLSSKSKDPEVQKEHHQSAISMSTSKPHTPSVIQTSQKRQQSDRNRYVKPAVTLMALVSAMAICMLPYCFYVIIVECLCQKCSYEFNLLKALLFLQFCNACLDPFLYAMTQRKIREFYIKTLKRVQSCALCKEGGHYSCR